MNDESSDLLGESAYQIPKSAVGILQRGEIDVYIIPTSDVENHTPQLVVALPFESGALLAGSSANLSADTDSLSVEYGAYRTFSLPKISEFRDDYERVRDQLRCREAGQAPEQQEPDLDAIQGFIDILVIVERAVQYVQSQDEDERGRHYRRVSALCNDPMEVIESIERAVDGQPEPASLLDKLQTTVSRKD
jgi:hypothetical protein